MPPEKTYDVKEVMTKFGFTVTVFAKAGEDGYRTWLTCPTCNASFPYPERRKDIGSAMAAIGMEGYMHARTHSRETPEYLRECEEFQRKRNRPWARFRRWVGRVAAALRDEESL